MSNIELKELWKNNKESFKEIENILLTKQHKFVRGRSGNVDLVLTFIPKQNKNDEDLFITVSGIYSIDELDRNIILAKDENGIKFIE